MNTIEPGDVVRLKGSGFPGGQMMVVRKVGFSEYSDASFNFQAADKREANAAHCVWMYQGEKRMSYFFIYELDQMEKT
jgi:hypothetical protein